MAPSSVLLQCTFHDAPLSISTGTKPESEFRSLAGSVSMSVDAGSGISHSAADDGAGAHDSSVERSVACIGASTRRSGLRCRAEIAHDPRLSSVDVRLSVRIGAGGTLA